MSKVVEIEIEIDFEIETAPHAGRFASAVHNIIGHPVMGFLELLGCHRLAARVHRATLPKEWL